MRKNIVNNIYQLLIPKILRYLFNYFKNKKFREKIKSKNDNHTYVVPYLKDSYLLLEKGSFQDKKFVDHNFEYELVIQDLMKMLVKPEDCIIDIGANHGLHTILLSKLAKNGTVFAIEPDKNSREKLNINLQLSGCTNVKVVNTAIGIKNKKLAFYTSKTRGQFDGSNSIYKESLLSMGVEDLNIKKEIVNVISLDSFVYKNKLKPNFIKMDIEGSEYDAFLGMKKTIKKYSPLLIFEFNSFYLKKSKRIEMNDILSPYYELRLVDVSEKLEYPISHNYVNAKYFSLEKVDMRYSNVSSHIICIPKAKYESLVTN